MSGPLNHEETIQRGRDGLGCLCRHEWQFGDLHCDGPLTMGGGGLCWTCAHLRHCEQPQQACIPIECPPMTMICFLCASEVEITENDEGRTWRCDCGRTHGVQLNEGALDLGLTPPVDPASP